VVGQILPEYLQRMQVLRQYLVHSRDSHHIQEILFPFNFQHPTDVEFSLVEFAGVGRANGQLRRAHA